MKHNKIILTGLSALLVFTACASTSSSENDSKSLSKSNTAAPEKIVIEQTAEEKFLSSISGVSINNVSTPKEIAKGKNFASAFVFEVKDGEDNALADFPISIVYPESRTEGKLTYATANVRSDENGKVSFTAPKTDFAANTKITAYPTPATDDEKLLETVKEMGAQTDWKVKSDIATKGAVLFIWDYNEKDRPVNNWYDVQAEFRTRGITMVGNGPINETSYIGKYQTLYKETYKVIGGSNYGYLIYGTNKFVKPVEALEDGSGYRCTMKAEIQAVRMKDGALVYSTELTHEATGKNWNACVSNCKEQLAKKLVTDLIYGL